MAFSLLQAFVTMELCAVSIKRLSTAMHSLVSALFLLCRSKNDHQRAHSTAKLHFLLQVQLILVLS
uniref:Uncharacterized protein n=1 Tax=Anguilla anguilla TaxID=7936 RepID=A0A0E9UR96_ANGAN